MKSIRKLSIVAYLSTLFVLVVTVTVCTGATPIGKVSDIEGNVKSIAGNPFKVTKRRSHN